jgi:hypothetical protein
METIKRELAVEYSLIGATAVLGDRRMLALEYAADAVLKLNDSTYSGRLQVVNAWVEFMRRSSVKEMVRQSQNLDARDSVYTDVGVYGMLSQRVGGKPIEQRGTYRSVWHLRSGTPRWELQRDEIIPDSRRRDR